ncbi:unnamed protein product [Cuscuta europaea]|uniref:Zinc finger LSD1-type domain-containing protein n=1 Tax=Cuscuta europaea TaxID=41803 RepID=A0A9P1EKZ2_CUSEU|nr:unnamed protein product [Cuscuta europaea]
MGREEVILSNPEIFLEEEEDDDGPPPGFDSIAINSKLEIMDVEDGGVEEDEDDGPPPGFAEPQPPQMLPPPPTTPPSTCYSDVHIGRQQNEDRSPLGWHSTSSKQPHSSMTSSEPVSDIQMGNDQEDDDGPPPGWQLNPQQQSLPESIPLPLPQSAPSSNIKTGITVEDDDGPPPGWNLISSQQKPPLLPQSLAPSGEHDDGPPPGWNLISSQQKPPLLPQSLAPSDIEKRSNEGKKGETERHISCSEWSSMPEHTSTPTPPLRSSSSIASSDIEMASKQQNKNNEDKKLSTERGSMQRLVSQLPPSIVQMSSEVGQLVCGTCRQLLSYPRGSNVVQCAACQTVNLALEAHQVGQVKCGGCTVLLMYPYGAPSVKCSSCHFTTRIGAQNRRPHLAAQQARRLRRSHHPH